MGCARQLAKKEDEQASVSIKDSTHLTPLFFFCRNGMKAISSSLLNLFNGEERAAQWNEGREERVRVNGFELR